MRISLKDCIQSAVSSPDPELTEPIELIQGAQLDLELQRRTTMTAVSGTSSRAESPVCRAASTSRRMRLRAYWRCDPFATPGQTSA
jgi:hypothetical protein